MANDERKRHAEPEAGVETELREVDGESGFGCADPEIGCQGKSHATADRRTLDRRDNRQWLIEQIRG